MTPGEGRPVYDPAGVLNIIPEELAAAEQDAREGAGHGGSFDYPVGSIGWLRARGVCCECGFAPASRVMVDPTCSPPLPYCERCIREINEARDLNGDPELGSACPNCGGDGHEIEGWECVLCDGSGICE
jgi:hypothetical protein